MAYRYQYYGLCKGSLVTNFFYQLIPMSSASSDDQSVFIVMPS